MDPEAEAAALTAEVVTSGRGRRRRAPSSSFRTEDSGSDSESVSAASVLARRAAGEARPTQAGLFEERPLPESERVERYLAGFDLGAAQSSWEPRDRGAALAALAATLPTGALWPLHDPLSSQRAGLACLTTWAAFERARAELLEPRVHRPAPPVAAPTALPFERPARPRA